MTIPAVLLEGARRAATYAAALFSLNAPAPAPPPAAQPPAATPAKAAPLAIDDSLAASGLTLAAHHLDVRIADGSASVQALMLLRNDRAVPVAVHYLLPDPARVVHGDALGLLSRADLSAPGDDADLSPQAAERAEAAPGRRVQRYDVIVVAPGEQISVEVQREVPVVVAGGVHRLQLPLPVDREAPWVPRFTADVLVEAGQPIRRLSSPTHPAQVDGLGETTALLSVPDGFVYRQTQLTVEFELGQEDAGRPVAALDRAPARGDR
jgi:hypothetical protein